jgi:hypothetical protein
MQYANRLGFGRMTLMRVSVVALGLLAVGFFGGGCSHEGGGTWHGVQVHFYSPDESTVQVRESGSGLEILSSDLVGHRLELSPEAFAVYDLTPGSYEFAYHGVDGIEDAVVYGKLEVCAPLNSVTRRFARHASLPIKLMSHDDQLMPHFYPSRDFSYTSGLESTEFDHVQQGDVIRKVYFVADLERVRNEYEVTYLQRINDINRELSVLDDREEYLTVRYESDRQTALQRQPDISMSDRMAHERYDWLGIEEPYIRHSRNLQQLRRCRESLLLKRKDLEEERDRRQALMRSLKVIHREGAMVLATPDLTAAFADPVAQARELGDVVAIVTYGGRHHYWANRDDRIVSEWRP